MGEALKALDPNKSADDGDGRPLKYRYCEKATKFEKKISHLVTSKQARDFFQIFVAFSENLDLTL